MAGTDAWIGTTADDTAAVWFTTAFIAPAALAVATAPTEGPTPPPAQAVATAPAPDLGVPAMATATAPVPALHDYGFASLVPTDGATLPTVRPTFVLGAGMPPNAGNLIEVQYAADAAFTSPTTLSATPVGTDGTPTRLAATVDLTAGTWWWRARLYLAGTATYSDWTAARSFTVNPATGTATAAGSWTAATNIPAPHLWFVRPDASQPDGNVVAYGTGFGTTGATATVAGTAATVTTQTPVAASGNAYTPARAIDPTGPVDVAHDELTLTVPNIPAPGGPLVVTTDTTALPNAAWAWDATDTPGTVDTAVTSLPGTVTLTPLGTEPVYLRDDNGHRALEFVCPTDAGFAWWRWTGTHPLGVDGYTLMLAGKFPTAAKKLVPNVRLADTVDAYIEIWIGTGPDFNGDRMNLAHGCHRPDGTFGWVDLYNTVGPTAGEMFLLEWRASPAGHFVRLNGVDLTMETFTAADGPSTGSLPNLGRADLRHGNPFSNLGERWWWHELRVWDGALPDSALTQARNYFGTKYGVTA